MNAGRVYRGDNTSNSSTVGTRRREARVYDDLESVGPSSTVIFSPLPVPFEPADDPSSFEPAIRPRRAAAVYVDLESPGADNGSSEGQRGDEQTLGLASAPTSHQRIHFDKLPRSPFGPTVFEQRKVLETAVLEYTGMKAKAKTGPGTFRRWSPQLVLFICMLQAVFLLVFLWGRSRGTFPLKTFEDSKDGVARVASCGEESHSQRLFQPSAAAPVSSSSALTPGGGRDPKRELSAADRAHVLAVTARLQRIMRDKIKAADLLLQLAESENASQKSKLARPTLTEEMDLETKSQGTALASSSLLDAISSVSHAASLSRQDPSTGANASLAQELFPPAARGTIPWNPEPGRYLLALCTYGRSSNQLLCLRRYAAFAALLNRTLIVPLYHNEGQRRQLHLSAFPWMDLSVTLDLPHWQSCVGAHRVVSVSDFLRQHRASELPVKAWWWVPAFGHLPICEALSRSPLTPIRLLQHEEPLSPDLKNGGWLLTGEHQAIPAGTAQRVLRVCRPAPIPFANASMRAFLAAFGQRPEPVISLGDVFEVTSDAADPIPSLMEGGPNGPLPLLPPCQLAMRPHRDVLRAARLFARSVLGRDYLAVHLRRGDFSSHCTRPGFRCWFPLRQLASCLARRVNAYAVAERSELVDGQAVVGADKEVKLGTGGIEESQTRRAGMFSGNQLGIFLATDTDDQEKAFFIHMLKAFVWVEVAVITYPQSYVESDAVLKAAGIASHPATLSTIEKVLCVGSTVFWGSHRSTFTYDVVRQREALGLSHCADDYVCGYAVPEKPFYWE